MWCRAAGRVWPPSSPELSGTLHARRLLHISLAVVSSRQGQANRAFKNESISHPLSHLLTVSCVSVTLRLHACQRSHTFSLLQQHWCGHTHACGRTCISVASFYRFRILPCEANLCRSPPPPRQSSPETIEVAKRRRVKQSDTAACGSSPPAVSNPDKCSLWCLLQQLIPFVEDEGSKRESRSGGQSRPASEERREIVEVNKVLCCGALFPCRLDFQEITTRESKHLLGVGIIAFQEAKRICSLMF